MGLIPLVHGVRTRVVWQPVTLVGDGCNNFAGKLDRKSLRKDFDLASVQRSDIASMLSCLQTRRKQKSISEGMTFCLVEDH